MDLPHTITFAILYRNRIDSFNELTKDKRPPRDLWDKPHALTEYLDNVFKTDTPKKKNDFYEYDMEDIE